MALVRLYWQHPQTLEKKFLEEGDFDDGADANNWAKEVFGSRSSSCPEGWGPMMEIPDQTTTKGEEV